MALRPSATMFVMAWCAPVGSSAGSSSSRTRLGELPCALRRPIVHRRRRDKVENARFHVLRGANVAQKLDRLAQPLLERLGLRCRRLAVRH
eukprot:3610982-Pleurochrysis_carterae.AAC.1